ncbi:glycoside hydrolase family 16 protein [Ceratobasidium sp. AG-Ba]|nr:glycoside hydrolase family 16 protein [Ceratobasidium sp. AG-Ba]
MNGGELVMTLGQWGHSTFFNSVCALWNDQCNDPYRQVGRRRYGFITMSDAKDEIDWEWPGAQLPRRKQTISGKRRLAKANYSATQGTTVKDLSDTYVNYHNYTIDWQEDELNWLIDGNVVRTLKRPIPCLPQSLVVTSTLPPLRASNSVCGPGIESSAPGTVEWAGGMINWQDPDYVTAGHFSAIVSEVTVKCAPLTGVANSSAMTSYVYAANDSTGVPTVQVTNHSTMLGGAVSGVRVGQSFWFGLSVGMLCAVAGVFAPLCRLTERLALWFAVVTLSLVIGFTD